MGIVNDLIGIDYRTASQAGTITTDGKFSYQEGETVTFSIDKKDIAVIPVASTLELLNIFGTLPTTELAVRSGLRTPELTRNMSDTRVIGAAQKATAGL